jgi:cellobiose PTS system EIIB component
MGPELSGPIFGGADMNILLCCGAGMSSSLLVTKMINSAQEQGIDAKISAVGEGAVEKAIKEADVLLVAPQIRYRVPKFKEFAKELNVPIDMINTVHYGTCNGAEVLKHALSLIKENRGL